VERELNAKPEGVLNMSIPRREKNKNFIVSSTSIVPWHSKDASIQDVSMMHCREVCVGACPKRVGSFGSSTRFLTRNE
jgi:hypothetical protein